MILNKRYRAKMKELESLKTQLFLCKGYDATLYFLRNENKNLRDRINKLCDEFKRADNFIKSLRGQISYYEDWLIPSLKEKNNGN